MGTRLQPGLLTAIDEWRRAQRDLPGRSEAIRRLVESALDRAVPVDPRTLGELARGMAAAGDVDRAVSQLIAAAKGNPALHQAITAGALEARCRALILASAPGAKAAKKKPRR